MDQEARIRAIAHAIQKCAMRITSRMERVEQGIHPHADVTLDMIELNLQGALRVIEAMDQLFHDLLP